MSALRYLTIILVTVSCNVTTHRTGFPETIQKITSQRGFDSVFVQFPQRVKVYNSILYITDLHTDEYFCHSFGYPSLEYQKSFARRGRAPNEFLSVGNIITDCSGNLFLLDVFAKRIYCRESQKINLITEISEEISMCLDFTIYNDSTFILPDFTGEHRLIFVNRNGDAVHKIGSIPASEYVNAPKTLLGQAWRSFIHYNPHNGIVALATQLGDVIEIYDLENNKTYLTVGLDGEPKLKGRNGGIMGYGDVFVGNSHIYAIYWGHEMDRIRSGEIKEQGGDLFRIFDLEGNPVRQYRIDRHITGFSVNETTNEVIGTDPNNEELIFFDL